MTRRRLHFPDVKVGDRVFFPADRDEGWNYEEGTIIGLNKKGQIVTVELDPKYRDGVDDDGLRETGTEFCRPITEKREN